jgi:hypothetical protein
MKKHFATFLIAILWLNSALFGYSLELNSSYDYFRGLPDGSWSGNNGGVAKANFGMCLYDCLGVQAGGSYGVYNWDGRGNVVFKNPKKVQQEGFVTAGLVASYESFSAGLVYDRYFTKNFGIYCLDPSFDQLRFHGGYQFGCEEVGVWGTAFLTSSHKRALGIPVKFRAMNQLNFFWSHFFQNGSKTVLWLGAPFRNSLMFRHKKPGSLIIGAALRAPLMERLYFDGYGSYMAARRSHGVKQTRNYAANICIGVTYLFGDACADAECSYLPVANHSNFLVDTNVNL